MEPFKPIAFTGITSSQKRWDETYRKRYQSICNKLNFLKFGIESLLNNEAELPGDLIIGFVKSLDPAQFLKQKYIQFKDISMPGIKQSALLDMIDIPEDLLSQLISERTALLEEYYKARERFDFPLASLLNKATEEDLISTFGLNEAFEQQLTAERTGYAMNQDQLTVVEAMQTFADSINNLINLGILRPNNINWLHDGPFNIKVLSFDPYSDKPVSLCRHMLSQIYLGMFKFSLAKYRTGNVRSSSNSIDETTTDNTTNAVEVPDTVNH